jgi:hypothetical protein
MSQAGPLEMIDQPCSGDFQLTGQGLTGKNHFDVVCDDAAIVRLRQVRCRCRRQILVANAAINLVANLPARRYDPAETSE